MRLTPLFLLAVIVGCSPSHAPQPAAVGSTNASTNTSGFEVVKLDPALDAIVSADAPLETIGDRFGLTEGPVWIQEGTTGYLLFSDLIANVIYKWTPGRQLSAFLENIYDGPDLLNVGQHGKCPTVVVTLNPNYLDKTEVTNEEYLLYLLATKSPRPPSSKR